MTSGQTNHFEFSSRFEIVNQSVTPFNHQLHQTIPKVQVARSEVGIIQL